MNPVTVCPYCNVGFTLDDLMTRPDIVPIGMMLQDDEAAWNFYYFNHTAEDCGTTFTVCVDAFAGLLTERVPEAIRAHSCVCEGHCTSLVDLAECQADCHWAPYRRLLPALLARSMPSRTP